MIKAPIQIRNPDVVRDIRTLAQRTGLALTDAVADAVRRRLQDADVEEQNRIEKRRRAVTKIVAKLRKLPIVGPVLDDDDLYDTDGLPK